MSIEDKLAMIDMFSELSKKELRSVERLMTPLSVKAGRVLMKEGESAREFVIIVEGKATVRRRNKVIAHVEAGDFLGEMAIIAGGPRTATVTADTDMILEVLNRREFNALLDDQPGIMRKVLTGAVKRLHELEPGITP